MSKTLLPVFLFTLGLVVSSCGGENSASSASGSDDVAASVNGKKILVKDVDRVITQQFRGQENQLAPLALAGYRPVLLP